MLLTETGYKPTDDQRFRIFLTNSLEEHHPDTGTLFSSWLADEANQANAIKRDAPVMVVIGNPPYSGESSNKGEWIMNLMEDYKKEPGGKEKLKEQNSKFINDDYVKFMRFGQHFIDKNGEGILAFINPHGYLDNFTFRGMRWNLLSSFDKIYTVDLHGNSKKKEIALDGSADQNVFDIMQGVSLSFLIKTGKKESDSLAKIFSYSLFGKREFKYEFLLENSLKTIPFKEIINLEPNYFFIDKQMDVALEKNTFMVNELFKLSSLGLLTKRDSLSINFSESSLIENVRYFLDKENSVEHVCQTFGLIVRDNDKWDANTVRDKVCKENISEDIKNVHYRPFDVRKVFYNSSFVARQNIKILGHFRCDNYGLVLGKQGQAVGSMPWNLGFITNSITDQNIYYRGGGTLFPLYLYPEPNSQQSAFTTTTRVPNLNLEIVGAFEKGLGLTFTPEKEEEGEVCFAGSSEVRSEFRQSFAPIDLLDYIYAVLHSPSYREKYKEFLKIDFPRVPYPTDAAEFWKLVALGGELRQLHLLESEKVEDYITQYPIDGDNVVSKPTYKEGNVYINETQYFKGVPEVAWNFYIGGYQPAQKWLKDRKGRELNYDDILHYQKMIVALSETARIMELL